MTIAIIGLGLIGGSMAISLKENGFADHIIGVDKQEESLKKALRRFIIDEASDLTTALEKANIIILATPVDAAMELLPFLLDQIKPSKVLMDVGSTKASLTDLVKNHPNRGQFVASHPMAGTEYSGIEAALPKLFKDKYTVICNQAESDTNSIAAVTALYAALDMKITKMESAEHDVHTAYISHISHISSFALAATVLEKEQNDQRIFELASSGFASTVRLAKSSPDMWTPIFRQNRDNVLDVLDAYIQQLTLFRTCLIEKDFELFYKKIEEANEIRRILR